MTGPELDILAAKIAERIASPRWMKLTAAVKYSSYSRAKLIELAERRDIVGYPDPDSNRGDWIFDKESIDEYRLSHFYGTREKALSILRSL
jgi:hypothetical protein